MDKIKLINQFNSRLPEKILRRNSLHYEFYCYINNAFSLMFSGMNKDVELFINRAKRFIGKHPDRVKLETDFYSYCEVLFNVILEEINNK